MFRLRRAPRGLPEEAVHAAELLVRRAWALELARRLKREDFSLRIERESCDTALTLMAAAQRDGDPRRISAARVAAVQARDDVYAAAAARDQARRELRRELRLLTRRPKKLSATVGGRGRLRSLPPAPFTRPRQRRGEGLRRLVRWRAADLRRQ